ncbi:MAG: glycosyltransferase family 2 protein [Phycisphaerales bacterium]|nr:glycosyltransferase family 2 protein [Phycisphaerales bacterium]
MKQLCVVILNYRRAELTIGCLESLADEMAMHPEWCAVVVENGSDDGSGDALGDAIRERGWSEWATLVRSEVNGGFAAGNNIGFQTIDAAQYMLLNSDARVTPGAMQIMLDVMATDPGIGMVGPRLQDPDGTPQISCFRYRTPMSEFLTAAGTGVLDRIFNRWIVALRVYDEQAEPPWLSFACVMIRREVVESVGLMDDQYFMYFEDIDYARQVRGRKWRIVHDPSAKVIHLRGGTSSVKKAMKARGRIPGYYFESRSRYFGKYYGGVFGVVLTNIAWSTGRAISAIREMIGNKTPHTAAREAVDNWINWVRPFDPPTPQRGGEL